MVDDRLANYSWECNKARDSDDIVCKGGGVDEEREIRIEDGKKSTIHIKDGNAEVEVSNRGRVVVEGGRTVDELLTKDNKIQRHINTNPIMKKGEEN